MINFRQRIPPVKGVLLALLISSFGGQVMFTGVAVAEETTVDKAQDKIGDAKTDTKKAFRTTKRKVRKATDNDTIMKDAEDKANDVGDDVSNSADKIKRKTK